MINEWSQRPPSGRTERKLLLYTQEAPMANQSFFTFPRNVHIAREEFSG